MIANYFTSSKAFADCTQHAGSFLSKHQAWAGLLLLASILLGQGCFHKDVMTDTADDIVNNLLYQGPEGNLIISKESIFQASSKSNEGGVTTISGTTDLRLSCYRIATGELAARVALGDMIEEANNLLGYSPGKIWMYSIDPEIGLHYRDPLTLEVGETWPQIAQKPGLNTLQLAKPAWTLIDQFFAFDWMRGQVLLTDETGFKYALDPSTFRLQKIEIDFPRVAWHQSIQNSSGEFKIDAPAYLEGDPRKIISFAGKKTHGDLSFLFGAWILDANPYAEGQRKQALADSLVHQLQSWKDSLASFSAQHPESNQEPNYQKWTFEQRRLHDRANEMRRAIEHLQREQENWTHTYNKVFDYPLLTSDRKSAYVLHANLVSDTAHCIVSRVNLAADSTWSRVWDTDLQGIYHDHNKADQAGAFEEVYSKGNPTFDYEWACTDGHFMVLVLQLHMLALDLKTGKLVWKIEI
jgi:hypothetical protein